MSNDRNYEDDDVRAIIDRALKAEPERGVSHDDLLAIGAEVGLSRSAVESAAREVEEARLTSAGTTRIIARRRRGVALHAFVFLIVNAFLFAVNFLTTPGEWWVLFSVFGWGIGLFFHAFFGLSSRVSTRRLNREQRRAQRFNAEKVPAQQLVERRAGVRVAGPLDQIEDARDSEPGASRTSRDP